MNQSDAAVLSHLVNTMVKDELHVAFVIGSGISAPAGVLPGSRLKEKLESEYSGTLELQPQYLEAKAAGGSYSLDFVISALVQVLGESRFLEVIAPHFPTRERLSVEGRPVAPTFAHEIIAHWMHYGGVQWAIDFNFDDLLAVALDDEAGLGAYGTCESALEFTTVADKLTLKGADDVLSRYRLVKPHGTIRLPKSLVKTDREVARFPEGTASVLRTILSQSAVVVVVGFSCSEPDFVDVLADVSTRDTLYIIVDPAPQVHGKLLAAGVRGDHVHYLQADADAFVRRVLATLRKRQREGEPPHLWGVFRHELRHLIFNDLQVPATVENRLRLAYLMHATKQRGYFNSDAFPYCHRIANYLSDRDLGPIAARVFDELCDNGTFTRYSGTWYALGDLPEQDEDDANQRFVERLETALNDSAGLRYGPEDSRRRVLELFRRLTEECDVEAEVDDQGRDVPLPNAHQLKSLVEVVRSSIEIADQAEKELDIISERGWWLVRPPRLLQRLRDRRVAVKLLLAGHAAPPGSRYREVQRTHFLSLQDSLGDLLKVKALSKDCGWRMTVNDKKVHGQGLAFRRVNKQVRSVFWRVSSEKDVGTLRDLFAEWWKTGETVATFEELEQVLT